MLTKFKETSSRWNCFSKVDLLGSFDFWTFTVSLDSLLPRDTIGLTVADLDMQNHASYDMVDYERRKKTLVLAAHEYTHFIDSTSTVWGVNHLRKINDVFSTPLTSEQEFFRLKKTYDHMRCIRLPNYYSTVDKNVSPKRPWRSNVTSGVIFNNSGQICDNTVFFVRFWNSDREPIARSPISLVSLLEASAMAKEIEVRINLLRRLATEEQVVEEKLLNDELLGYIYSPDLTEYSVCFHLLANISGSTDIGVTARAVGWLVRLILNMPKISFVTASKNVKIYADKVGLPHNDLSVKRLKAALDQCNHGAMFFLLSVLLAEGNLGSRMRFFSSVEIALKSIGLSMEKLSRAAKAEVRECMEELSKSSSEALRTIAEAGNNNFLSLYPDKLDYPLQNLALPPSLHGDLEPYYFSPADHNQLRAYDIDNAYENLVEGQLRAENFAEACM